MPTIWEWSGRAKPTKAFPAQNREMRRVFLGVGVAGGGGSLITECLRNEDPSRWKGAGSGIHGSPSSKKNLAGTHQRWSLAFSMTTGKGVGVVTEF